jgi:cytochrome d ubiquinol oxidase subunit I
MDPLDLARWQFGITTVYHFLFVPLTISLAFLVAGLQTAWVRTGDEKYLRATKFFGKLFLINFAMGVVTGIVQEFQFGMNWSDYSRFVGDIFGAPLAIEALLTFFLESTFLGLWIFGWDRLPKRVHLATIWAAAVGTALSAYMILAANAWMQHPVGYEFNAELNRAELTDFGQVLFQNTAVVAWLHTMAASFVAGAAFLMGVSLYLILKDKSADMARTTLRLGAVVAIVAGLGTVVTGDLSAKIMVAQQPMKMAAAEAVWDTASGVPFSLLTIGTLDGEQEVFTLGVPGLASWLATGSLDGQIEGMNDLNEQYLEQFGEATGITDFRPNVPVTYWTFRLMMGFGAASILLGLLGLLLTRGGRTPRSRWLLVMAVAIPLLGILASSAGWIFTEMGRQPWIVFGVMGTAAGVSPGVPAATVLTSLITFTLLYAALAVIEVGLLVRAIRIGPPEAVVDPFGTDHDADADRPLTFAY